MRLNESPISKRSAFTFFAGLFPLAVLAQPVEYDFESADQLDAFTVPEGTVEIDNTLAYSGDSSLKINPGALAELILREDDGGAVITMWVYDDMTVPADPEARRVGARWGLLQSDGRFHGPSLIYAPYLATQNNYVAVDKGPNSPWYSSMQYLSQVRRSEGWQKWTFSMEPDIGLKLLFNDREIDAYKWRNTEFMGLNGLAFFGDDVMDGDEQTIWVDDLRIELMGPMTVTPDNNPDTPVPPEDPAYEGPPIGLVLDPETHPRLLFDAGHVEMMNDLYDEFTSEGRFFKLNFNSYSDWARGRPMTNDWISNDTDAQEWGFWKLPSIALRWVMREEEPYKLKAIAMLEKMKRAENWQNSREIDSGMGMGNNLMGAALAFDWLYDDLEPEFREEFREKLWEMARRQYYLGHLNRGGGDSGYWSNDPGNNHRFHRNAGLSMAILAAYRGEPEQDWMLSKLKEEMDLILHYLPYDGTSHEGPYYFVFGLPYITMAAMVMDRNMGTNYLQHPYFRNGPMFRAQSTAPGFTESLRFGDDNGGFGAYNMPLYVPLWRFNLPDAYPAIDELRRENTTAFRHTWMAYAFVHENRGEVGDIENVPTRVRFPDIDVAYIRDGWALNDKAAMFKCGPFGGYALNEFRDEHDFTYINVAHNDPDANSFIIWKDQTLVAKTDRYSNSKQSANHNTILVDGIGQESPGRSEGGRWTQPSRANRTMSDMAYITAWKDAGQIVFAEGEASNSYHKATLTRFRRAFIWNEDKYVLVVDDIRAEEDEDITWMIQSGAVSEVDAANGVYQLQAEDDAVLDFQVVSSVDYTTEVVDSVANNRQLRLEATGDDLKFASVYAVWDIPVSVEMDLTDPDNATITVTGDGFTDTWTWTAAPDETSPGSFVLSSTDGQTLESVVDEADEFFKGLNYRNGGWMKSDWFGWMFSDTFPWIYSLKHGWTYFSGDHQTTYFWTEAEGWNLTTWSLYPWAFSYDQGDWIRSE